MTLTVQQSRTLSWVVYLLAACTTLALVWDNPMPLLLGPVLIFLSSLFFARALQPPLAVSWFIGTMLSYAVLMAICLFFTSEASNDSTILTTLSCVESWVGAYLLSRFIRARQVSPLGLPAKTTATQPHGTPTASLNDPVAKQVIAWVEHYFPMPLSRKYAAIAAAMRALEQGQDGESARQAAEQATLAWAPPAGVAIRFIADLTSQGPWKDIPYQALSQGFAIEAAVLRALELGQDEAAAVAAGKQMGIAWILPTGQHLPTKK